MAEGNLDEMPLQELAILYRLKQVENNYSDSVKLLCGQLLFDVDDSNMSETAKLAIHNIFRKLSNNENDSRKILASSASGRPKNGSLLLEQILQAKRVAILKAEGVPLYQSRDDEGAFVLVAKELFGDDPTEANIRMVRSSWEKHGQNAMDSVINPITPPDFEIDVPNKFFDIDGEPFED